MGQIPHSTSAWLFLGVMVVCASASPVNPTNAASAGSVSIPIPSWWMPSYFDYYNDGSIGQSYGNDSESDNNVEPDGDDGQRRYYRSVDVAEPTSTLRNDSDIVVDISSDSIKNNYNETDSFDGTSDKSDYIYENLSDETGMTHKRSVEEQAIYYPNDNEQAHEYAYYDSSDSNEINVDVTSADGSNETGNVNVHGNKKHWESTDGTEDSNVYDYGDYSENKQVEFHDGKQMELNSTVNIHGSDEDVAATYIYYDQPTHSYDYDDRINSDSNELTVNENFINDENGDNLNFDGNQLHKRHSRSLSTEQPHPIANSLLNFFKDKTSEKSNSDARSPANGKNANDPYQPEQQELKMISRTINPALMKDDREKISIRNLAELLGHADETSMTISPIYLYLPWRPETRWFFSKTSNPLGTLRSLLAQASAAQNEQQAGSRLDTSGTQGFWDSLPMTATGQKTLGSTRKTLSNLLQATGSSQQATSSSSALSVVLLKLKRAEKYNQRLLKQVQRLRSLVRQRSLLECSGQKQLNQ